MHEQYSVHCYKRRVTYSVRSCCKVLQSFIGIADVACRGLWRVWLEISQNCNFKDTGPTTKVLKFDRLYCNDCHTSCWAVRFKRKEVPYGRKIWRGI